jgi:hypothetical protein
VTVIDVHDDVVEAAMSRDGRRPRALLTSRTDASWRCEAAADENCSWTKRTIVAPCRR